MLGHLITSYDKVQRLHMEMEQRALRCLAHVSCTYKIKKKTPADIKGPFLDSKPKMIASQRYSILCPDNKERAANVLPSTMQRAPFYRVPLLRESLSLNIFK